MPYGEPDGSARSEALSVSSAMALAKGALESVTVRLIGEVSELSNKPGYKAVYFTVKDSGASLPCMMWNNRYQASGVELRIGALVELTGRFTLYAVKGRMNFDVFSVSLAGEGALRLQVANLVRKLQAEGLTAPERKRPLPQYPQLIGMVTSPRGATVHDVLRTLRRRYPLGRVLLAGVTVEGPRAPADMIEAMQRVVMAGAEVVLLIRGGGSYEDFMPFNDESLARAIADMPVPVVTGIGHEPDTCVADLVADLRTSSPTAAAEIVAPPVDAVYAQLASYASSLATSERSRVDVCRMKLDRLAMFSLFREPERLFETEAMALDDLSSRLSTAIPRALEGDRRKLELVRAMLAQSMPRLTAAAHERTSALSERVRYQGDANLARFRGDVKMAAARLNDLSPLTVLTRGYSIARDGTGCVVKSVGDVRADDALAVSVADGVLNCRVVDALRIDMSVVEMGENNE